MPRPGPRKWIGRLRREFSLRVSGRGVSGVEMLRSPHPDEAGRDDSPLARQAREEIAEYLAGRRRSFRVRADLSSLPPFQRAVLRATQRIPYGETRSYGWVAERIGKPGAARAVGQALGRNPVPLIVP